MDRTECSSSSLLAGRAPTMSIALALSVGILIDHVCSLSFTRWLTAASLTVLVSSGLIGLRRWRFAAVSVLTGFVCVGGLLHHRDWSTRAANDLARFATEESRLVRMDGVLTTRPVIRSRDVSPMPAAYPQVEETVTVLECHSLQTINEPIAVTGRVQLRVSGHLTNCTVGDRVRVLGWLSVPTPPRNPGEFDYAAYLRRQGIGAIVRSGHPDAIEHLGTAENSWLVRLLNRIQTEAETYLINRLGPDHGAVASALLIGQRSRLPESIRDQFALTGMMHLLAISGLHVAIFAGFVWVACRLMFLTPRTTGWVLLFAVWALAIVSGLRPPILRASLFLTIAIVGQLTSRPTRLLNTLGVTVAILLLCDPLMLFDTGAQLSLLSVLGIFWSQSWPRRETTEDYADESRLPTPWRDAFNTLSRFVIDSARVMLGIWLLTAPLIAFSFQLVSPIGLLLNLLLVPLATPLLGFGYALLLFGPAWPPLGAFFGSLFNALLSALLFIVDLAATVPTGHLSISSVPTWWLIGYYLGFAGMLWRWRNKSQPLRPILFGGLSWLAVGLIATSVPSRPAELRCTFLAVGHGVAVLIETPNGGTVLYDAGAIDDPTRPARVVTTALAHAHRLGLNGLIVSHADIDHFNGVPGLLDDVPVAGMFVAQSLLDFDQSGVAVLCESASQHRVPIRLIGAGDELKLDPQVTMTVLAPEPSVRHETDNANSVVLLIEYAGRSILLTGDLEANGLAELTQSARQVDVLMIPHHGSLRTDHVSLGRWAGTQAAIASSGQHGLTEKLQPMYPPSTQIFSTADDGAVTVTVSETGQLAVTPTLSR